MKINKGRKMGRALSVEYYDKPVFITTKTINSRLWFANNNKLKIQIMAFLAKYQAMYNVIIYGFIILDNHYHLLASFPSGNRSKFLQSFNGIIAKLTKFYVPDFKDGKLWAKRASVQILGNDDDVEHWLYYIYLNAVSSGLVKDVEDYECGNSYFFFINQKNPTFKLFSKKRGKSKQSTSEEYTLILTRLKKYTNMKREQFIEYVKDKIKIRTDEIINNRVRNKKSFLGKNKLAKVKPGSEPKSTKKSSIHSKYPLILTLCMETKKVFLKWYFSIYEKFKNASSEFRAGNQNVTFPRECHSPCARISTI